MEIVFPSDSDEATSTVSLAIRCFTCRGSFTPRLAVGRSAWLQRVGTRTDGTAASVHLCGGCAATFSSADAALDFLDGVLEHQRAAAPEVPVAAVPRAAAASAVTEAIDDSQEQAAS
jgi:hypothetical protein